MDDFRKASQHMVSVGGWKCSCCGPKTAEDKRRIRKASRATLKKELRHESHTGEQ